MWRTTGLGGILACASLLAGCPSPSVNPPVEGAIIDVNPREIAQGRTVNVHIRGDGTNWTTASTGPAQISFGPQITIDAVTVANAQNLFVDITASGISPPGIREVSVEGSLSFANVFAVRPPLTIQSAVPQTLRRGSFFSFTLIGAGSDWQSGTTTIDMGAGIYFSGQVLGQTLRADVLATDRLEAFGYVDAFAAEGTRSITVNGATITDTLVDGVLIGTVTPAALAAGVPATGSIPSPNTSELYSVTTAVAHDIALSITAGGSADPVGYLFHSSNGRVPVAVIDPAAPVARKTFAAETLTLAVFDTQLGGGAGFDFTASYTDVDLVATLITTGVTLADEELTAMGDTNWYYFTATAPWLLADVTVTPTQAAGMSEIDPVLTFERGETTVTTVDAAAEDLPETMTELVGTTLTAVFSCKDEDDNSAGMDSRSDVDFVETAIAGLLQASVDANVEIADTASAVTPVVTEFTIDYNQTNNAVVAAHVMIDIVHPNRNELEIDLVSPMGTTVRLENAGGANGRGLLVAFPDTATEAGDLTDFNGENPMGIWTLQIADSVPGDAGVLRGWALSIED